MPDRDCPHCGGRLDALTAPCLVCSKDDGEQGQESCMLKWEVDIPLLTNPVLLKQFILVAAGSGFFMALILSVIFAATGEWNQIPIVLLVSLVAAAGLMTLFLLVGLLIFGNRVRVRFTVDEKGALWENADNRVRRVNRLAILAGVLGKNPQAAGAGLMAASREQEYMDWKEVRSADYNRRHRMVLLRGTLRPAMLVVATQENYDLLAALVEKKTAGALAAVSAKRSLRPLLRALLRTALVSLAAAPLFALSASYYIDFDLFLPLCAFLLSLTVTWLAPLLAWGTLVVVVLIGMQLMLIAYSELIYLTGGEQLLLILAIAGLVYLGWYSREALRGKVLPPLFDS